MVEPGTVVLLGGPSNVTGGITKDTKTEVKGMSVVSWVVGHNNICISFRIVSRQLLRG